MYQYAAGREKDKFTFKKMLEGTDVLRRITVMTLHYPGRMAVAVAASLTAVVFQLFIPGLLGTAVDNAYTLLGNDSADGTQRALFVTGLLLFGASVLRGLFTMLHNYMGEDVGQRIGYELRISIYDKIQRLDFRYHDHADSGDLITRSMLDIEGVRLFINTGVLRMVILTLLIGVAAVYLLITDWVLALLSLSFVPIVGWRAIDSRLSLRESWHRLQDQLSIMTRIMEENLRGIRVVRAFAGREYEMEKFGVSSDRAKDLTFERIGIRIRNGTFMTFAFFISMGLVLLVGGYKTLEGDITVGQLTAFLAYMSILQMPVRQLGMLVNSIARATSSGERLFAILDEEPDIKDKPGAPNLEVKDGVLRFEDVDFSYRSGADEIRVLTGITFEVRRGQVLGIVGPPGAGKSTIAHLIPRFYDVSGGRITIDGQDIREVNLKSLRQAVSVIQQDNFLFTSGIENNIAYGNPWADRDRIVSATNAAQLHDYIRGLPRKYGTLVGERGVSLSGGQRQRLVIARSLLVEPSVMVLDDSTAAIDAATEQRILKALAEMGKDRIVIVIAHRLGSLMHADEILFIDEGGIVERGSHQELLKQGGRYSALYELQSNPAYKSLLD